MPGEKLGTVSLSGRELTYDPGEAGIERLEAAIEDSEGLNHLDATIRYHRPRGSW